MAVRFRTEDVHIPKRMEEELDSYLQEDEEIIDVVSETYIPNFDFRWLILTNQRLIQATYRWFEYQFHDVKFEELDMHYNKEPIFANLEIKSKTYQYTASFYNFNEERNKRFIDEVKQAQLDFQLQKMKKEKEMEYEAEEELEEEGVLPEDYEKIKHENQKACEECETIEELMKLRDEGAISKEEYEAKKKELLKKIE